jgi:hypothetical protein
MSAQTVSGLVALKMKTVKRDYLWPVQIPEHIDESRVVSPDTEFMLKPKHMVRAWFYRTQDISCAVIVAARYGVLNAIS